MFRTLKSCNLQVELSLLFIFIIIGKSIEKKYKNLKYKMQLLFNIDLIIDKLGLDWLASIYFTSFTLFGK